MSLGHCPLGCEGHSHDTQTRPQGPETWPKVWQGLTVLELFPYVRCVTKHPTLSGPSAWLLGPLTPGLASQRQAPWGSQVPAGPLPNFCLGLEISTERGHTQPPASVRLSALATVSPSQARVREVPDPGHCSEGLPSA